MHLEVFARNRVVLVGTGIGTRPPRRTVTGRVVAARCYGAAVTLDPTGLVLVRPGAHLSVGDVFRSWGQPLTGARLAGFHAPPGSRTRVFVDGRRRRGMPGGVPLRRHAEIVLELAPFVAPHPSYRFGPGT